MQKLNISHFLFHKKMILIFNSFQMSEPSYGDYTYPQWGIGIGWGLAILPMLPIPLVAIVLISRENGPLLQVIIFHHMGYVGVA